MLTKCCEDTQGCKLLFPATLSIRYFRFAHTCCHGLRAAQRVDHAIHTIQRVLFGFPGSDEMEVEAATIYVGYHGATSKLQTELIVCGTAEGSPTIEDMMSPEDRTVEKCFHRSRTEKERCNGYVCGSTQSQA